MILADEPATEEFGRLLAGRVHPGDVVTLSGPLGVGKTALARAMLKALGHDGEVPSPTFAIVQPYEDLALPVWHADLYRIEEAGEIDELGLDGAEQGLLIVEWPERAGPASFPGALRLVMDFAAGGARRLTADVPPAWDKRWPR